MLCAPSHLSTFYMATIIVMSNSQPSVRLLLHTTGFCPPSISPPLFHPIRLTPFFLTTEFRLPFPRLFHPARVRSPGLPQILTSSCRPSHRMSHIARFHPLFQTPNLRPFLASRLLFRMSHPPTRPLFQTRNSPFQDLPKTPAPQKLQPWTQHRKPQMLQHLACRKYSGQLKIRLRRYWTHENARFTHMPKQLGQFSVSSLRFVYFHIPFQ
jgi:hypothetical protein